jgi:hypothetical protein
VRRSAAILVLLLAFVAVASFAAAAVAAPGDGNGRQTLSFTCDSGPLAGQTIDVSVAPDDANGASGFVDGSVYVLESITVTVQGAGIVYQHDYGQRNGAGAPSHCVAQAGPATIDTVVASVGPAT